jgi:hypothetical protein
MFWRLTYSPSVTNKAWKHVSLQLMKPKHDSLHVHWHPTLKWWRATSDVRINDFDIQLNCAEHGLNLKICFLQQIYVSGATATIRLCLTNEYSRHDDTNHIKGVMILTPQIICATFHFLIWIAPNEEIRVLALDLSLSLQKIIANYYLSQLNKCLCDVRHVD